MAKKVFRARRKKDGAEFFVTESQFPVYVNSSDWDTEALVVDSKGKAKPAPKSTTPDAEEE
jgi:hypothetical protein